MKNKKINFRGELTTQQIVVLVILIVSFIVVLFFLFQLNLGEKTDKELCRNSVILKGKSIFPQEATQLKCYRSYKCITKDGSCEGLSNPEVVKVENLDEIYSQVANEMADCWWMFGERSVNYLGSDELQKNNYCSICSQIAFDNSLNEIPGIENGKINKNQIYKYLEESKIKNQDITYLEYLFGIRDLQKIKETAKLQFGTDNFGEIQTGKQFFVVTGITSGVSHAEWIGISSATIGGLTGTILGVVALAGSGPPGWIAGAIVLGGIAGGAAIGEGAAQISELQNPEIGGIIVDGREVENKFMVPTLVEANSEKFKALNCEEILTLS